MPEQYAIRLKNSRPEFEKDDSALPDSILKIPFLGAVDDPAPVCRLGDPALLCCSVFRDNSCGGGVFVVRDQDEVLFSCLAADNLTYAIAMAYFARMVADCRYGADIYENMDNPDE